MRRQNVLRLLSGEGEGRHSQMPHGSQGTSPTALMTQNGKPGGPGSSLQAAPRDAEPPDLTPLAHGPRTASSRARPRNLASHILSECPCQIVPVPSLSREAEKGMSGIDSEPLDFQGVTGSHGTETKGKSHLHSLQEMLSLSPQTACSSSQLRQNAIFLSVVCTGANLNEYYSHTPVQTL